MLAKRTRGFLTSMIPAAQFVTASAVGLLLGFASTRFSPLWILGGLFGLIGLVVLAQRPEFGILIIVTITCGLIDYERLPLLQFGPVTLHMTDAVLLFLTAMVVLRAFPIAEVRFFSTPLDIFVIWFLAAIIFSGVLSYTQYGTDLHWIVQLTRPLTYYLGFFVVTNLITTKRQLITLINGLFVIAMYAAVAMFLQLIFPSLHLIKSTQMELNTAGQEYSGVTRTFTQAERLIFVMLPISVCSLALGSRWVPQIVEFGRAGLLFMGLFLTFQRNYWLSMMLVMGALALLMSWPTRFRLLKWASLGIVALVLVLSLTGNALTHYLEAAVQRIGWGMRVETLSTDSSTQMRVMETGYALQSILRNPLWGVGLGNVYRPYYPDDNWFRPDNPALGLRWYMHNSYLWVFVIAGVVGFIPFMSLYGFFLYRGFRKWKEMSDLKLRAVVLGATLGIAGQAVSNIVAPNFTQSWSLIVFAALMGVNELVYHWNTTMVKPHGPPPSVAQGRS